jgi:hypothetical protein
VSTSEVDQARVRIGQQVPFNFRIAQHHPVPIDDDKAGFAEVAQIARQGFRLHVEAGGQHFLAGFQRHRGFTRFIPLRPGQFEQVAQQALPRRP